jgi:hypothetical protein
MFVSTRILGFAGRLAIASVLTGVVALSLFNVLPAHATAGVNQQLNYQARLLDSTGAIVPDGNYNVRFKVYQDGTGAATGNPGGTLKWTEIWQNSNTQGVTVRNGYMSVQLGSLCALSGGSCQGNTNAGIDFNQDTLWLSIDVGGVTTGASPTYDGEMVPMRRLGAAAYALNSNQLGGLTSSQFLQLAPGSVQGDGSTNSSLFVNKTGASGNIVQLQRASTNVLTVGNDGAMTVRTTSNSTTALQVLNGSGFPQLTVDSTNNKLIIGNVTSTLGQGVAGTLVLADGTNDNFSANLALAGTLSGNVTFQLPNGYTGNQAICISGGNCSYAAATGGSGYIQNQFGGNQQANLKVQSPGDNTTVAIVSNGTQTADLLEIQSSGGGILAGVSANGTIFSAPVSTPAGVPSNARSFFQANSNTSSSMLLRASASGTGVSSDADIMRVQDKNGNNTLFAIGANGTLSVRNASTNNVFRVGTDGADDNNGNLITTPSFENASTTGWTGNGGCTLSSVTTQYYVGLSAGQCANTATAGAEFRFVTGALSTNSVYVLSFFAKASSGGSVLNFGHVENGGGEDVAGLSMTSQSLSANGWIRYTLSFKTGGTLAAGDYIYIKQNDATARNLWVDGAMLQTDANAEGNFREGKVQVSGTVSSPMILQGDTNYSNAFQVQNSTGYSVFSVDTTDTNLLTNPGVEVNQQGWTAKGSAAITRDTAQQKFGQASLKTTTTAAANDGAQFTFGSSLPVGTYTIAISVKNSGTGFGAGAFVAGLTNGGGDNNCTLSPSVTTTVPTTTGWTRFVCTVTVATTAATAFYVKQTEAVIHTFWIDGVEVGAGSTATPYGSGALSINGVIKTPLSLQNQSDSTTALALYNAANTSLFVVDTLNSAVFIGSQTADATGAQLVLDTKNTSGDPATGYNGAMYYNSSTHSFRCFQNSVWTSCIGGMRFSNTSVPTAITATTDTNFGTSYTIPANDCVPGRVYRITAYGTYTNSTTATNATVKVKFGSTVLATTVATVMTVSATLGWQLDAQVICITASATGTVEAQGRLFNSTSTTASNVVQMVNTAVVGSINTTTTQQVQLSAAVSQAVGAPSITLREFVVEALGP